MTKEENEADQQLKQQPVQLVQDSMYLKIQRNEQIQTSLRTFVEQIQIEQQYKRLHPSVVERVLSNSYILQSSTAQLLQTALNNG